MYKEEIAAILDLMVQSIDLIRERFSKIRLPDDFALSQEGVTLLDAISMRLQVIGESVKRIDKMDNSFLDCYPEVEWVKIAKFRDLVSHHYEQVDYEIVYDICKIHVPRLKEVLSRMLTDVSGK